MDREVKKDLGGYVVIVESEEDVQKLNKEVIIYHFKKILNLKNHIKKK